MMIVVIVVVGMYDMYDIVCVYGVCIYIYLNGVD